ncbi:hybrid sensor histidine kinase/response regulator [Aerosakkonema funiforme]|uniref:hybrid sensor histidine kinase/response regulator n=1 Tax=Aerosakkonema funiforme TaxID=1246630 RepID=UPI0035B90F1E
MNSESSEQGIILIVDDTPTNLGSMVDCLTKSGFTVWVARSGQSAIKKVQYSPPDLILLDVIMPEMDGFETCQRLKENESTKDIPVIFMTALDDTESKVKGFNIGAVDYITKPLQHEEVLARVKTHLSIRNLTKKLLREIGDREKAQAELQTLAQNLETRVKERTAELSQTNERLEQEIADRKLAEAALQQSLHELKLAQSQLIQSEKMSALGQLVTGVAHEINNPVNFIYGNISYIRDYTKDLLHIIKLYQNNYPNPSGEIEKQTEEIDLGFLKEDLPKILQSMQIGADRIREIVLSLRHFSRQEEYEMSAVNIHEGIDSTLMILHNRLKFKPERPAIEVIKEYTSNLPPVECLCGEINQVFMNILVNAIDALDEYNKKRTIQEIQAHPSHIMIRTEVIENNKIAIQISDNGPGMTEEVRSRIFNPFFTTKAPGKGTGIGLSISWQIVVEKHRGSLRCFSEPGKGTEFAIEIPIRQESTVLAISA